MKTFIITRTERIDPETEEFSVILVTQDKEKTVEFIKEISILENESYCLEIWEYDERIKGIAIDSNYIFLDNILLKLDKHSTILEYLFNTSEGKIDKDYLRQTITFIRSL